MNFEDLQKANELIKTTDIGKGKEYAEVNQRIKAYRSIFPEGCITTELLSLENGVAIFKATVTNGAGAVLGTGHAYEKENSNFINKTSFIENCETSAIGRALAMCGFGIDTSVASFEEVANAKENQNKPEEKPKQEPKAKKEPKPELITLIMKAELLAEMNRTGISTHDVCKECKIKTIDDMTTEMHKKIMRKFALTPNGALNG